ncbi:MAG: VOC family protein [Alphaproteobacteria bacterium]|jgi:predicted 3-demethylubiquinone-9 3-methyltransferase (glyoxalase superfamily)|nr:VOC family protein [Alphaproteobacteria bacterium]
MKTITPCLWFDGNAEEAVKFYTSIFKDGKILSTSYYGPGMHLPEGTVLTITFEIMGQQFMALNGGPEFKFDEAISLMIPCDTQEEIDYYWDKLTAAGGQPVQCGWLKDKFGLSWQVVPRIIEKHLNDKDQAKTNRVMKAVMGMVKLDIAEIEKAYKEG